VALTKKQRAFLAAFRECGVISHAAQMSNVNRSRHYQWLDAKEEYADAFRDAHEEAIDRLESEARRRACEGVVTIKFDKDGNPLRDPRKVDEDGLLKDGCDDPWYYEHTYSDNLLAKLLAAHRPEKFGNKLTQEISGPGGKPIELHAVRRIALSNPELSEQLCQALDNATESVEDPE